MNKQMKFLFAALFIVIIVLAAAIARFNSAADKNTHEGGSQSAIAKKLGTDGSGNLLFQDSSGLYGIADSSERVVVSPEWESLKFTGSSVCIAEKHIRGHLLHGCIDYEGNVAVPFIFDSIEKKQAGSYTFYAAKSHADGSYVIYSSDFTPCFTNSWKEFAFSDGEITFSTEKGSYIYAVTPHGFALKRAEILGSALSHEFKVDITSKLLLSKLTVSMLEDMTEASGKYLEYAFLGDEKYLSEIRKADDPVFFTLFPNEERIKSKKLTGVSDIFLYSTKGEDDCQHFAVSVTAEADIVYLDDNNKNAHMNGKYKAIVEFSGENAGELAALSGSFDDEAPEYPAPEAEHPLINVAAEQEETGYSAGSSDTLTSSITEPVTEYIMN